MPFLIIVSSAALFLQLFWLATPYLSMHWGNVEAPMWRHVTTFPGENAGESFDVIMIGDSRSKAAWFPDKTKSHVNLSLGGGTPIEAYKLLKMLYDKDIKIKKLLLSFSPYHLMKENSYFERTVNFQFISIWEHLYLRYQSYIMDDYGVLREKASYWDYALPGGKVDQIAASFDGKRSKLNHALLEMLTENRGHTFYGRAEGSSQLFEEFLLQPMKFEFSPVLDMLLTKTIELAQSKNTEVYWVYTPFNASSCKMLPKPYIEAYTSYLRDLKIRKLNQFGCFPDEMFGDPSHLFKGAPYFTQALNQLL